MSSPPIPYLRYFDFTTFATLYPDKPLPGGSVDVEYNRLKTTTDTLISRLGEIQRSDGKLQDGAITTSSLLDGSVTTPKIADAAVTAAKLAPGAVGGGAIAPGSIGSAQLADGGIATVDIADFAVTGAKIGNNAIDPTKMGVASVATAALQDGAVTNAKLGPLSVSTSTLIDGSVTTPKLADGSVTTAKLAPGSVIPIAIPDNSLTSAKIMDGTLQTVDYAAQSVTTPIIADGAVTGPKIAAGSITGAHIADGTINPVDLSATTVALMTAAGNPRGAWATATNYATKDAVTQGSGVYVCITAHLSGVFATDLAAGKWYQTGQIFDQMLNTFNAVQFAKLGIGAPAADLLDITDNANNGVSQFKMLNTNGGNAARMLEVLDNGLSQLLLAHMGTGYTPGGPWKPNASMVGTTGASLSLMSFAANSPLIFGTNNTERARIDDSGALTVQGPVVSTNLGGRNLLINGDFRVNQRFKTDYANVVAGETYVVDRWAAWCSQAGKVAVKTPSYFVFFQAQASNVPAPGDTYIFYQKVEYSNYVELAFGTAQASPVTLSFMINTTAAGTYGGSLRNDTANFRSYPFSFTLQANVWTKVVVTIPGDQAGVWDATNPCIGLYLNLGCGATVLGSIPNVWQDGAYYGPPGSFNFLGTVNAQIYLMQAKLEPGFVATPFVPDDLEVSLAKCQRYFQMNIYTDTGSRVGTLQCYSPTSAVGKMKDFPVTMRASPTAQLSATADFSIADAGGGLHNLTGFFMTTIPYEVSCGNAIIGTSSLVGGNATTISPIRAGCYIAYNAEL